MKKILPLPSLPSDTLIYNAALGIVIGNESGAYTWQCLNGIKLRIREPEQLNFDDRLFLEYPGEIPFIDRKCISDSEYCRIVEDSDESLTVFLTDQLNRNRYVYVFFDHYFVPELNAYHSFHFIHDGLIYGFDDENAQFYMMTYTKDQKFNSMCVDYKNLSEAVRGNSMDNCRIMFCLPLSFDFELTVYDLYERLAVYRSLSGNADHSVSFNIGIYETLIEEIALINGMDGFDFRTYKLLCEHYRCVQHILDCIGSQLPDEALTDEREKIEDCITHADILFKLVIKYNLTCSEAVKERIEAQVRHLYMTEAALIDMLMPKLRKRMEELPHE